MPPKSKPPINEADQLSEILESRSGTDSLAHSLMEMIIEGLTEETDVPFREYAKNPVGFLYEILGVSYLTQEQVEICNLLLGRPVVNVPAAHGVGKDFLAARLIIWFVFAVGGRAFTTAPTEQQVKDILWYEVRTAYDKSRALLGGERGELFLRYSEAAKAVGFTSREYSTDSFQGKHGDKLLFVLDEANGISQEIDDGAMSCITGANNHLLRIGNPVAGGTAFESACSTTSYPIPVWTHPNIAWAYEQDDNGMHRLKPEVAEKICWPEGPDEDGELIMPQHLWPDDCPRDVIPGAVSIAWVERVRRNKGEDSAFWQGRVEARFPTDQIRSIIPRSYWLAARARYDRDPDYWDSRAREAMPRHGLDVGDGNDPHAWAMWRGPVFYSVKEQPTVGDREDTARAVDWALDTILERNQGSIAIDCVGVGSGVYSHTVRGIKQRPWKSSAKAYAVNFGLSGSHVNPQFKNLRAQQYWALRIALEEGEVACAPLGKRVEEKLFSGFAKIPYYEGRVIYLPEKRELRTSKFLGRSPDSEDATVMGFNVPVILKGAAAPRRKVRSGGQRTSVQRSSIIQGGFR